MADEGFPATVLLGFCVPCPKRALKLLSKIPPCVQKTHQAVWKGSYLLQMQRRQKPNTRNRPGKKKWNQNQEERKVRQRSQQGDCKETGRQFQKWWNWGWKRKQIWWKVRLIESVCDCGAKSLEHLADNGNTTRHEQQQTQTGGRRGDKCCLETGKAHILKEKPGGKDTGLNRQGDWE